MSNAKELLARIKEKQKRDYESGLSEVDDSVIDNTDKESFRNKTVAEKMAYPAIQTAKILHGIVLAVMIFGSAGIGKTYGVLKALNESGRTWVLTEDEKAEMTDEQMDEWAEKPAPSLVKITGNITRKGLYKVLYQYRKGFIIMFDDCDDVLRDKDQQNMLKGALDNGVDQRIVSWESSVKSDLPNSFLFESQIIFISNMTADKVDKAVRSRADDINLVLTPDEAYEHIGNCLPFIETTRLDENNERVVIDIDLETKRQIFERISERRHSMPEYSFRTFKKAVGLYQFCLETGGKYADDWFDLWDDQQDEISQ